MIPPSRAALPKMRHAAASEAGSGDHHRCLAIDANPSGPRPAFDHCEDADHVNRVTARSQVGSGIQDIWRSATGRFKSPWEPRNQARPTRACRATSRRFLPFRRYHPFFGGPESSAEPTNRSPWLWAVCGRGLFRFPVVEVRQSRHGLPGGSEPPSAKTGVRCREPDFKGAATGAPDRPLDPRGVDGGCRPPPRVMLALPVASPPTEPDVEKGPQHRDSSEPEDDFEGRHTQTSGWDLIVMSQSAKRAIQ